MIIFRYLSRQVLFTTLAITLILLLVVVSGRLANYIADAAQGSLAANLLFPVVLFRLPQFLELILPVSLLLGIVISFGQLYETNEMTVLSASGIGHGHVLRITMVSALFIASVVAAFSFYLSPKGIGHANQLIEAQGLQSELGSLAPGNFYQLEKRGSIIYAGAVSSDRDSMSDVFVFRPESGEEHPKQTVIKAQSGYQEIHDSGAQYFVLEDGVRYEGLPGNADFTITRFERYSQLIEMPELTLNSDKLESLAITELLVNDPAVRGELHWRLSLPVMTLILGVLAVPLSRSSPRQGRYLKLVPGLLLYLVYVVVLSAGRNQVTEEGANPYLVVWSIHAVVLVSAVTLFFWPNLRVLLAKRPPSVAP